MEKEAIRCLFVEDDEADRLMFKRVFSCLTFDCVADYANSLESARRHLLDYDYTLLILDNSLQDGKGADFVMELARSRRLAKVPILIVSDWPTPFIYAKAKSCNVLEVMTKRQFNADTLSEYLQGDLSSR